MRWLRVELGFKLRSLQRQAPSSSPLSRPEKLNDLSQITSYSERGSKASSQRLLLPQATPVTRVTQEHGTTCDMYGACCCFCLHIQIPFQKRPLPRANSLPAPMDPPPLLFSHCFALTASQCPATQSDRAPRSPSEESSGGSSFSNPNKWRRDMLP